MEGVIKNPNHVTNEVVGEVKFKVADVVTNPGYRTKDGDAAFLEKGTKLYRIEGFKTNEIIAVKDEKRIGGYRLYTEDGFTKTVRHHYKDVPKDKVERVELYHQEDVNTDDPIACAFTFADDGTNVFFSPWYTRIVEKEIRTLIEP